VSITLVQQLELHLGDELGQHCHRGVLCALPLRLLGHGLGVALAHEVGRAVECMISVILTAFIELILNILVEALDFDSLK